MIDLHSHILPELDDGASSLDMSIEMARIAVEDGTTHIACTSHITPGVYHNTKAIISERMKVLQAALAESEIELKLLEGADVHVSPDIEGGLQKGEIPTLARSKYFLFEPPHHVLPPRLIEFTKRLLAADYVPVLTHPERLSWIEDNYPIIREMDEAGVAIQLTAASITGRFGKRPKYWSERMLDEGRVDIIASDAHNTSSRPPGLSQARDAVNERLGENLGSKMVLDNPRLIIENHPLPAKIRSEVTDEPAKKKGWLDGWFK